jgi:hypothetical protein
MGLVDGCAWGFAPAAVRLRQSLFGKMNVGLA